jgi:ribA/ribD-fused uncharacterized protein
MSAPDPLDVEQLRAAVASGQSVKYLFFWGHTPRRKDVVGKECLSQWYPASFVVHGTMYRTAEHFMMHQKALLFGDDEAAARVLSARHPNEAKAIGREIRGFREKVWAERRFEIVCEGSQAKFSQNEEIARFLLGTKGRVLVEASPRDDIWGIGVSESDARARAPDRWPGMNLLGFALMHARAALQPA